MDYLSFVLPRLRWRCQSLVEMVNHRCKSLPNSNKVEGGALAWGGHHVILTLHCSPGYRRRIRVQTFSAVVWIPCSSNCWTWPLRLSDRMAWTCIRNGLGGSWMQSYTHPSLPSWSGGIPRSILKIMVAPRICQGDHLSVEWDTGSSQFVYWELYNRRRASSSRPSSWPRG